MSVNVREKIRKLNSTQRKKVAARAAALIAEEMSTALASQGPQAYPDSCREGARDHQDSVSRLEKRSDLLLSTLRKTIKAMGGDVRIVAQFPDRAPVVLSQLSEEHPRHKSSRKYARRAAAR